MAILNFGSLNIDHVYSVERFVAPGETLGVAEYSVFSGGKGLNQSIALARAGAEVIHAGCVGEDGRWLLAELDALGVDVSHVRVVDAATGHAIIQVDSSGENCILVHAGANRSITSEHVDTALGAVRAIGSVLLQNETNHLDSILERAGALGMNVILNPSPLSESLLSAPLGNVGTFVLNRLEGEMLSGESSVDAILGALRERFPSAAVVLTLGEEGVRYVDSEVEHRVEAQRVTAVDTTAAGDTFTGFFVAARSRGEPVVEALRFACRAAALCVQRPGASASIPRRDEL